MSFRARDELSIILSSSSSCYRYRAISGMRKLSKPKEKTVVRISKGDEKCPLRKTKNKNKKQKIKVKGKLKNNRSYRNYSIKRRSLEQKY